MNDISAQLRTGVPRDAPLCVPDCGSFSLREADESWVRPMLVAAASYYGRPVRALQIVPDAAHWTIDIPDMRLPWDPAAEPAWHYLQERWSLCVPSTSIVCTGLDVARGAPVTHITRRDDDYWEMFSAAGAPGCEDMRGMAITTLLGRDESLRLALVLENGRGLERASPEAPWQAVENPDAIQ